MYGYWDMAKGLDGCLFFIIAAIDLKSIKTPFGFYFSFVQHLSSISIQVHKCFETASVQSLW
jgi:hypothetical protein